MFCLKPYILSPSSPSASVYVIFRFFNPTAFHTAGNLQIRYSRHCSLKTSASPKACAVDRIHQLVPVARTFSAFSGTIFLSFQPNHCRYNIPKYILSSDKTVDSSVCGNGCNTSSCNNLLGCVISIHRFIPLTVRVLSAGR